jgi:hypothetical protein
MAHFARVENGIVQQVIVISNDDCAGGNFPESEAAGQAFIASLGLDGEWVQTSYSGSFRESYAAVGCHFDGKRFFGVFQNICCDDCADADLDEFVTPESETSDDAE